MEKVNKNMYHIFSIKSENQEVFWTFHVAVMQINGKEMYKKSVLQLDLLLFFRILVKGTCTQQLFSVKYLFGKQILPRIFFHLAKNF